MICRPASNVPNGPDAPTVAYWLNIAVVPGVSDSPDLPVVRVERTLQLEIDLVAAADVFAALDAPEAGIDAAVLELIDMPQVAGVWAGTMPPRCFDTAVHYRARHRA